MTLSFSPLFRLNKEGHCHCHHHHHLHYEHDHLWFNQSYLIVKSNRSVWPKDHAWLEFGNRAKNLNKTHSHWFRKQFRELPIILECFWWPFFNLNPDFNSNATIWKSIVLVHSLTTNEFVIQICLRRKIQLWESVCMSNMLKFKTFGTDVGRGNVSSWTDPRELFLLDWDFVGILDKLQRSVVRWRRQWTLPWMFVRTRRTVRHHHYPRSCRTRPRWVLRHFHAGWSSKRRTDPEENEWVRALLPSRATTDIFF